MAQVNTTALIIETTDQGGKKQQKSITNVNPNATTAQLSAFAQGYTALSTDTFVDAVRVQRRSVATNKPAPTFRLLDGPNGNVKNSTTWQEIKTSVGGGIIDTNSTATPYVKSNTTLATTTIYYTLDPDDPQYNGWSFDLNPIADDATLDDLAGKLYCDRGITVLHKYGTIVVAIDETDDYAAAEFTLTVTES